MPEAYIIDAVRTPRGVGKPGKGALSHLHPQHLAATVLKALKDRNNLDTATVDDIIWSTSTQKGKQGGDLGRMAALDAGFDIRASGMTLDRFCGGGITSVNLAAAQVMSGMEDCVIAGGTEMMSYTQTIGAEEFAAGIKPMGMGSGNAHLQKIHPQSHQGVCGDAIAAMEGISREAVDALGLESQRRADIAIREGRFAKSVVPVLNEDGSVALDHEEFPRPTTTAEGLAGLEGVVRCYRRRVDPARWPDLPPVDHRANTPICSFRAFTMPAIHRASSMVPPRSCSTSPAYAEKHGLKPRARIVATANIGDCPTLMLNAPVPAARKVLEKAGLTVDDIDLWEINEAFAVVAEKFIRDLKLDRDKVNVNGGAIALGHPIGATGSILIGTVLDELERRGLKRGLVTMCAAGGMAPAIIIERL